MNHLAQCVFHYAQCLWETQALLAPAVDEPAATAPSIVLADRYLVSLSTSLMRLPHAERAALARAARHGWQLRASGAPSSDPVREALIQGHGLHAVRALPRGLRPWEDPSLAALTLRSLRYALDLSQALPDPDAPLASSGPATALHATLWRTAHAIDEQQARLWDAVESITRAEADALAEVARAQVPHAPSGTQHADLLAYFASGIFVERLKARG